MTTTSTQYPALTTTGPHTGDTDQLTVQALAAKYAALFTIGTDNDGKLSWRILAPTAQLDALIKTVHGYAPLDDYTKGYIRDAFRLIAQTTEGEETDGIDEIKSDQSSSDLLRWLSSNHYRPAYVDDYIEESLSGNKSPEFDGLFDIISQGQYLERQEVFYSVLEYLLKITKKA